MNALIIPKKQENFSTTESQVIAQIRWERTPPATYLNLNDDPFDGTIRGNLVITFTSLHKYLYKNVPFPLYNEFKTAESIGQFFNQHIKGKFECHYLGRKKDS